MSEMVERVSRAVLQAISEAGGLICMSAATWDEVSPEFRGGVLLAMARAAIAAMREPTMEMRRAGEKMSLSEGAHDCEVRSWVIYVAMIDAALGEQK